MPEWYQVEFPNHTSSFPFFKLTNTGQCREVIADGGYTADQFIGTGIFTFDYNINTSTLDLELKDSTTVYSLLLHLVDDRHPRSECPFYGETHQTYSLSFPLSEIKTRMNECN